MTEAGLQDAMRLRRAGRLAEAAQIYQAILKDQPRHYEALHALGILNYQAGRFEEAERLIGEATRVNPKAADALYNRGSLLLKLNRIEEAVASFGRALDVMPDYAEALGNRGAALMQLGRPADAVQDFAKLVRLKPALPEGWINLGGAQARLDRADDALASYEKAIALRPDHPEARKGRAGVLFARNNFAAALADADVALSKSPNDAQAQELRANALAELGRREEAVQSYMRALQLRPGNPDALYNRGNNLMALRRLDEAARDFVDVLRLAPDYPYALGNLTFAKLCNCDWQGLDAELTAITTDVRAGKPVVPFQALVLCPEPADALMSARTVIARKYPAQRPLWNGEIYRHERIRVAYLSADFHDHAVARQMAGVFEHHDRRRFEIHALSFGPDSNTPMRQRLLRAFDSFQDMRLEAAERVAQRLRDMEIDIAVDLMGFTETSRPDILSHRPAPVQVNYLGYPGTMGADYFDYIIADRFVIPESEAPAYAEQVVRLPHCYLPADKRRLIGSTPSRVAAGLPAQGFVFCCFNHPYKIGSRIFDVWMRLLDASPGSVLWLSHMAPGPLANLRREAAARGIAPERLVFAPYVQSDADHLARLKLADLFLDTVPYNAHATASDALWAGVPVLTLMGNGFPGRVGASLLTALGLRELIAPSIAAYESMALRFAKEPDLLSDVRKTLSRNHDTMPLFDTAKFARGLEGAYAAMAERAQKRLPPTSFTVEDRA
jgi:protein O-GlcNAc transferase